MRRRRNAVTPGSEWALVTGAGSGIGKCYATRLAELGYNVIIAGNIAQPLFDLQKDLTETYAGINVEVLVMDLARVEASDELYNRVKEAGIEITVLVNNAGVFSFCDILNTPVERIDRMLFLHDLTMSKNCRLFGADMAVRGRGYILNMSSFSVWMPWPGMALYGGTKAFVRSFTKSLAWEMRQHGVNVTAVCPAGVATDLYGLPSKWQRIGRNLKVLVSPDYCARHGLNALWRGKRCIVPDWWNRIGIPLCMILPQWLIKPLRKYTMQFQK